MSSRITGLAAGVLLGALGLTAASAIPAAAGQVPGSGSAAGLQLTLAQPIINLGETVTLRGAGFTPGATVTFYLHGPSSATLGRVYGTLTVDRAGRFVERIAVANYPDALARQYHTVMVAAVSSAQIAGNQEGAAVSIQADPVPSVAVVTHGPLTGVSWTINGMEVTPRVTALDRTHYVLRYAGHLRAGQYSAYLKWRDATGHYGTRVWSFQMGDPRVVPAQPRLMLSAARIRLGQSVIVSGQGFTPGATVAFSLGGMNTLPHATGASAVAGAYGAFTLRLRIAAYPDAAARRSGVVIISAGASGAAVGDLPEGVAVPLTVAQ